MTTKAAEDFEDIARRLKELEADRQLALTGSTVEEKPAEMPQAYPDYYGLNAQYQNYGALTSQYQANSQYQTYGMYTPSGFNEAARRYMGNVNTGSASAQASSRCQSSNAEYNQYNSGYGGLNNGYPYK